MIKLVPIIIFEPLVIFQVLRTIQSESIGRFPLDKSVNKICGFGTPSSWNLVSFNLYLLRKYVITDLFAIFPYIWSFGKHTLVRNYAHCKVVDRNTVVLSAHHFWCHVTGSSRSILGVLWIPNSCNSKICYSQITLLIKNKIFWLYVPM